MSAASKTQTKKPARAIVMSMMALTGALFFFVFVVEDLQVRQDVTLDQIPIALLAGYIIAMGIGGALAGAVLAGLFGRSGATGWISATFAGVVASMLAGLFGSAVATAPGVLERGWSMADAVSIGFGALVVPLSFADQPVVFALWAVLIAATHLWTRSRRAEQN